MVTVLLDVYAIRWDGSQVGWGLSLFMPITLIYTEVGILIEEVRTIPRVAD